MNAHAKVAAPAPAQSEVQALASLYGQARRLEEALEAEELRSLQPKRFIYLPLDRIAAAAMHAPPGSLGDIALTLAIAGSWAGFVGDALGEDSAHHAVCLGIGSALENATLFLARIPDLPVEGEALEVLNMLLAAAVRSGAEVAVGAAESIDPHMEWLAAYRRTLADFDANYVADPGSDQAMRERVSEIARRIVTTPATTRDGLLAKALLVADLHLGIDDTDDANRVLADAVALNVLEARS